MPHDLVIGGSGMLASLCEQLARSGHVVSVIARDGTRLQALAGRGAPGRILPAIADYRDLGALEHALVRTVDDHGPPTRCFCWVHEEIAPNAPLHIANHVDGIFWHILSSAAGNPAQPQILSDWRQDFRRSEPGLDYRQIVLGFVAGAETSRWLTDAEISDGVYSAIENPNPLIVVGTVSPWSRRP